MNESKLRYRLGIDLGSGSIGWCMVRLNEDHEPYAIIRTGVRIFSTGRSPKDESSLAVNRRQARQMRRRRDRLLKRKNRLIQALVELGFWPQDAEARRALAKLDPYELRFRGLDQPLEPEEFGRALFHLNQRRGFLSNRKTDRAKDDRGLLKEAISNLREQMNNDGARTLGEWLYRRKQRGLPTRARMKGSTAKDRGYDFYFDRAMVRAEFDQLWEAQRRLWESERHFVPEFLSRDRQARLAEIIFFQRKLRPVMPGRCTFLPEEPRASLALPSAQRLRILQDLNHLRWSDQDLIEHSLTLEQRDKLARDLERRDLSFDRIRRLLGLPQSVRFNLESGTRKKLEGNRTSLLLSKTQYLGESWHELDEARQDAIVEKLLQEEDEKTLARWLQDELRISAEQAQKLADAHLPEGYAALSRKAIALLLPALRQAVIPYSQAVEAAGLGSHSALSHGERSAERLPRLPYYGEVLTRHIAFGTGNPSDPPEKRWGRIANPTVHIGLNELRKVINALIDRYGHPHEIVLELARELKQSRRRREEEKERQKKRQGQNEKYRGEISAILGIPATNVSPSDLEKMRLWVELNPHDPTDRRCPYTGEQISMHRLFSPDVEVEHILPFSRTLDDSLNNKTVCLRRANHDKGNRTPYEAFGHSPPGYDYAAILQRAAKMPQEKAKRFAPDGYERWLREDADFLARQLTDTAYLARLAREYLTTICPPNRVWVVPGRLTALLRTRFQLNALLGGNQTKNRDDHRHHAIDAAVIAITDRGFLQKMAAAAAQAEEAGIARVLRGLTEPWSGFREQLRRAIERTYVSYRPDHSYEGQMHNDTAYGLRPDGRVVQRKMLTAFKDRKDLEKTEFIDSRLKKKLLEKTMGYESGAQFIERITAFTRETGIRRVRVVENLQVIPIREPAQLQRHGTDERGEPRPYKGYKGDSNYCLEIWLNDQGGWEGRVISTFEAYRIVRENGGGEEGFRALRNPVQAQNGMPLIMRLVRGDYVSIRDGDRRKLMRVAVIRANGQLSLHEHHEANVDARDRDQEDPFRYTKKTPSTLQKCDALPATVSPIGDLKLHRPRALRHARTLPRNH